MSSTNRNNFSKKVKQKLADQAGNCCSFDNCNRPTSGPTKDGTGVHNGGDAAHISAAAVGGRRYDLNMTPEQRRSASNGIWLCTFHHRIIDGPDDTYTSEELHRMKRARLNTASQELLYGKLAKETLANQPTGLPVNAKVAFDAVRRATKADLRRLKDTREWPPTEIPLRLQGLGDNNSFTSVEGARLFHGTRHLTITADPGFGKTSVLLQMLDTAGEDKNIAAMHVSLPHWALKTDDIFTHLLARRAFVDIDRKTITQAIKEGQVWLILDGWNELGDKGRKLAIASLENLQSEWPELMLMVATRTDTGRVPLDAADLKVLPLSLHQQEEIARTLAPKNGLARLASARKQTDLSPILKVPLYLRALLSLPTELEIPESREELIAHMAKIEHKSSLRLEQLRTTLDGQAIAYMRALATFGLNIGQTAISESQARRAVSDCSRQLVADGQISNRPSPRIILDTLAGHMGLLSRPRNSGYSFDHHQFQEWYGSHTAEAVIISASSDLSKTVDLRTLINRRGWSEALLFATDRLAVGKQNSHIALADATITAFWVDPNVCATWLRRHGSILWPQICTQIKPHLDRWKFQDWESWLAFCANAALPELAPEVVEVLQTHPEVAPYRLMSSSRSLRADVFGSEPTKSIESLPQKTRTEVLFELAAGIDEAGQDIALEAALATPTAEFRLRILDYLSWQGPLHRASKLIRESDDSLVTDFVKRLWPDETLIGLDDDVIERLNVVHAKILASSQSPFDQLRRWVDTKNRRVSAKDGNAKRIVDLDTETVTTLISTIDLSRDKNSTPGADMRQNAAKQVILSAFECNPNAVRVGLIERMRLGLEVPYQSYSMLDDPSVLVDKPWVTERLRATGPRYDPSISRLAVLLSKEAVADLLNDTMTAYAEVLDHQRPVPQPLVDRWRTFEGRVSLAQPERLAHAVRHMVETLSVKQMGILKNILKRPDNGRPYGLDAQIDIREIFSIAATNVLRDGATDRRLLTDVSYIASIIPNADNLTLVQKLAEAESNQLQKFVDEVERDGFRHHRNGRTQAWNEVSWRHEGEFGRVFESLPGNDVRVAMKNYLSHSRLGPMAAQTLLVRWLTDNQPDRRQNSFGDNFDLLRLNRQKFELGEAQNCQEADWIFEAASERWDKAGDDRESRGRVFEMVQSGSRLPHQQHWPFIECVVESANARTAGDILNMVGWSGRKLPMDLILKGAAKLMKEAETHSWLLSSERDGQQWLKLSAFAENSLVVFDVLKLLPESFREQDNMKTFVQWLGAMTPPNGDIVLDTLAKQDSNWLKNLEWRKAAERFDSVVLRKRIAAAALSGKAEGVRYQGDPSGAYLQSLVRKDEIIRKQFLDALISTDQNVAARAASTLVWSGDTELFLAALDAAEQLNEFPASWRLVSSLVSSRRQDPNWANSYVEVPKDATFFRAELLKRVYTSSKKIALLSLSTLRDIDAIRRESGAPSSEPRHPEIESKLTWPVLDEGLGLFEL